MRVGIIAQVHGLMKRNKNVYFLTGDLGYSVLERIEKDFPDRFINVGLAEQNMIGIASGLAMSGKKVFVYSIIPFVTMRCFEQIRNDICYHSLDVTILGVGAGLSYGILSCTHFALEDVAILRTLPNMTIFAPADETEAVLGMRSVFNFKHPLYIRIGKKIEDVIYKKPYSFVLGKGKILSHGKDIVIFTSGPITSEVIQVNELLKQKGISATIINIHTFPIDQKLVVKYAAGKKVIFSVEEHGIIGGLGSAISEIVAEYVKGVNVVRIGTPHGFIKYVGSQSFLRKKIGLDAQGIYKKIIKNL